MRKWLNVLMEAGLINASEQPVMMHYIADDGSKASFIIDTAEDHLQEALNEAEVNNPAVRQWFETVFLNYVKRHGRPPGDFELSVGLEEVGEYIREYAIDIIWDNPDPSIRPSRDRYGNGERADPRSRIIEDDMLASLPAWARTGFIVIFFQFAHEQAAQALIDYLTAMVEQDNRIDRMSVQDAIRFSFEWHQKQLHGTSQDVEGTDIKTVLLFPDGYRIVQILTPKGLDRESAFCHHCIGGGGYDRTVRAGQTLVFSLRDPENNPHATLAAIGDRIVQLKGHQNGAVTPKLHQHIKDFILSASLRLASDHQNIGLDRLTPKKSA